MDVDYLDIADRAWPILGPLMRAHAAVYRATNGRIGGAVRGLPSEVLAVGHVSERRRPPLAALYNPHWANYRHRTEREIPLVILEPQ